MTEVHHSVGQRSSATWEVNELRCNGAQAMTHSGCLHDTSSRKRATNRLYEHVYRELSLGVKENEQSHVRTRSQLKVATPDGRAMRGAGRFRNAARARGEARCGIECAGYCSHGMHGRSGGHPHGPGSGGGSNVYGLPVHSIVVEPTGSKLPSARMLLTRML